RLARWAAELIRLPLSLLKEMASISDLLKDESGQGAPIHLPNSVGNLSDTDPFIAATAKLPISPKVHYHSIIGLYKPHGDLAHSSDGVVPYASAHLAGAASEVVIPSWHNVQEAPAAILELRRIMRRHLQRVGGAASTTQLEQAGGKAAAPG
ncbi:MAG: alpha/beta hydrolase, partial [Xanthomonadaceae bacterium]|nr:alpha/beta hydrolase [Xanthomonadaceae bacterium]